MKYRIISALLVFCFSTFPTGQVIARNIRVIVPGGEVHIHGKITAGACIVSSDSQDMHINMGNYTTHSFEHIGDLSSTGIPFSIKLSDCKPGIASGVGITFSGITAPKESDVFLVTTLEDRPLGISGAGGFSGLGLLISDSLGNQIIPGKSPIVFHQINSNDMELHYIARYRATSRGVYPGKLLSEVRFDIAYP